jgi:hypothetical protein
MITKSEAAAADYTWTSPSRTNEQSTPKRRNERTGHAGGCRTILVSQDERLLVFSQHLLAAGKQLRFGYFAGINLGE